jgi:putative transposase
VPVAVVVDYIDAHRDRIVEGKKLGVEPICTAVPHGVVGFEG